MRVIEERDVESKILSVLVIFNESELQDKQEIKSLIQLCQYQNQVEKKYQFVSHYQRGGNEYMGI